jgi:uncharacterized membrane protein
MMVFWTLLVIVLVGAMIWAVTGSVRGAQPPSAGEASRRSAGEILDERHVRGELDPNEYDRLREKLERPAAQRSPTAV